VTPHRRPIMQGRDCPESRIRTRELMASGDLPDEPEPRYFWTGGRVAHLHAACDALWKQERMKPSPH